MSGVFVSDCTREPVRARASGLSGSRDHLPDRGGRGSAVDVHVALQRRHAGSHAGLQLDRLGRHDYRRSGHRSNQSRHHRARGSNDSCVAFNGRLQPRVRGRLRRDDPGTETGRPPFRRVSGHLAQRRKSPSRQLRDRVAKRSDLDCLRHRLSRQDW